MDLHANHVPLEDLQHYSLTCIVRLVEYFSNEHYLETLLYSLYILQCTCIYTCLLCCVVEGTEPEQ